MHARVFLELRLITSYSMKGIFTLNEAIAFNRKASVFLFFPFGGVWSFCFMLAQLINFQLGKTDHDFIPVPRTGMKFERVMFNTFASP